MTTFATPLGGVVTIALTKYADYEKLKALRDATGRMNQIFPDAMHIFSEIAFSNITITRSVLFAKYKRSHEAYIEAIDAKTKNVGAITTLADEMKKPQENIRYASRRFRQSDLNFLPMTGRHFST